jgi:hypothetical protein
MELASLRRNSLRDKVTDKSVYTYLKVRLSGIVHGKIRNLRSVLELGGILDRGSIHDGVVALLGELWPRVTLILHDGGVQVGFQGEPSDVAVNGLEEGQLVPLDALASVPGAVRVGVVGLAFASDGPLPLQGELAVEVGGGRAEGPGDRGGVLEQLTRGGDAAVVVGRLILLGHDVWTPGWRGCLLTLLLQSRSNLGSLVPGTRTRELQLRLEDLLTLRRILQQDLRHALRAAAADLLLPKGVCICLSAVNSRIA